MKVHTRLLLKCDRVGLEEQNGENSQESAARDKKWGCGLGKKKVPK